MHDVCFNFWTGNRLTNKKKSHWISSTVKNKKKVSFYSSIQEIFALHFLAQTFQISFLVWFQLEPERHTGCLRSQPKFHLSFWARRKLNLLIKSQYIHKMKFLHRNHRSQTPCQYRPSYHTLSRGESCM